MEEPTTPPATAMSGAGADVRSSPSPSPPPPSKELTLVQPTQKQRHKNKPKLYRIFCSVVRSFPIITPIYNFANLLSPRLIDPHQGLSGAPVTGTLFGHRKGKVSLSIQETRRCVPTVCIELPMQTMVLQKELAAGMVRVALECEKLQSPKERIKTTVMEEEAWTAYCNGKMMGVAVKREVTGEDLNVMELLKAVSTGAGVLPAVGEVEATEEMVYIRAHFEHVVGSKDCETLYMMSPDDNVNGPELSIFFLRV